VELKEIRNNRVLISPLNWGMGHVSRCIGLINELLENKNRIYIACNEQQKKIFQCYFDDVDYLKHEGYPFKFGDKGLFSFDLLKSAGKLAKRRKQEGLQVSAFVDRFNIDIIIADHRYGFRSDDVFSVFLTHQLNLPVVWYEFLVQWFHKKLIRKFDEVWIMDFSDNRLAGKLSRNNGAFNARYIGPYSRFQLYDIPNEKGLDSVLIASGPVVYAQQLIDQELLHLSESTIAVIADKAIDVPEEIKKVSDDWKKQDALILDANKIVSRSGYSTIMDVHFLKINAQLIPTPGQREQIYLSELHNNGNGN